MSGAASFVKRLVVMTPLTVVAVVAPNEVCADVIVANRFESGNDLFDFCNQSPNFFYGMCAGYIVGVADAMMGSQAAGGSMAGWNACFPQNVSNTQVRDIALKFLNAHPEIRHANAAPLVARALSEAFPCR